MISWVTRSRAGSPSGGVGVGRSLVVVTGIASAQWRRRSTVKLLGPTSLDSEASKRWGLAKLGSGGDQIIMNLPALRASAGGES